jgi:hypothetical protein
MLHPSQQSHTRCCAPYEGEGRAGAAQAAGHQVHPARCCAAYEGEGRAAAAQLGAGTQALNGAAYEGEGIAGAAQQAGQEAQKGHKQSSGRRGAKPNPELLQHRAPPAVGGGVGGVMKGGEGVSWGQPHRPPPQVGVGGAKGLGRGRPRTVPQPDTALGNVAHAGDRAVASTCAAREGRSVSATSRRRPAAMIPPRDINSAGESSGAANHSSADYNPANHSPANHSLANHSQANYGLDGSPQNEMEMQAAEGCTPGYMRRGEERQYTGTYKRYTGKVRATPPAARSLTTQS